MNELIKLVETEYSTRRETVPAFKAGDDVNVHVKIKEGNKAMGEGISTGIEPANCPHTARSGHRRILDGREINREFVRSTSMRSFPNHTVLCDEFVLLQVWSGYFDRRP